MSALEQRGLPASRVALESIGPEEPASISDSRVATRTGPFPHLNASKIVPSLQVECGKSTGGVQNNQRDNVYRLRATFYRFTAMSTG
jgi:hypothetical protein